MQNLRTLIVALTLCASATSAAGQERVVVGSKKFTESYVLGEVVAQLLERRGIEVERRFGLGGTLVCYTALREGEIDVYVEYSGTIEQAILKSTTRSDLAGLRSRLNAEFALDVLAPLGFNNTYAIACRRDYAREHGLRSIADLSRVTGARYAFSHEFLERSDGWKGLAGHYGLSATPRGIEHGLAYQAIADGKIDVTDVYSTDGDIAKYDLVLLEDDRGYFPAYLAVPLVRSDSPANMRAIVGELAGVLDEEKMQRLNGKVLLDGASFASVASSFLAEQGLVAEGAARASTFWRTLLARTAVHLQLTLIALLASIVLAVPLGVLVYRARGVSKSVVYLAGVLQTIPSIALLALMIPLFGIGAVPAIVALFLYALLPILRNTTSALFSIDPTIKRVATGIGMSKWQRLRYVELPLAAPTILAGVKTAAVINIGTATLAAFIGAGGLGEPIVTGLALNDTGLIMEGAIPAAVLAILIELLFELIERFAVPKHLAQAGPR